MSSPFEECPINLAARTRPTERASDADPVVTVDSAGGTQLFFPDWGSVDWARAMVAALGLVGRISVHHLSAMPALEGTPAVGRGGMDTRPGGPGSARDEGESHPRAA